jgi:hypothetical protein
VQVSPNNPFAKELRHISSFLPNQIGSSDTPFVTLNDAIKDGYIRFLNQWEWQWYYTLTFTDDIHPEQSDRLFKKWISKLNRHYFGRNHHKRNQYIDWIRSTEYQKRGVIHYHGLINAASDRNIHH